MTRIAVEPRGDLWTVETGQGDQTYGSRVQAVSAALRIARMLEHESGRGVRVVARRPEGGLETVHPPAIVAEALVVGVPA